MNKKSHKIFLTNYVKCNYLEWELSFWVCEGSNTADLFSLTQCQT